MNIIILLQIHIFNFAIFLVIIFLNNYIIINNELSFWSFCDVNRKLNKSNLLNYFSISLHN
jgi:hypothetical protein